MLAVVPMRCSAAVADVHFEGNWDTGQAAGLSELAELEETQLLPTGCSCWGKREAALGTGGGVSAPGRSWRGDTCSRSDCKEEKRASDCAAAAPARLGVPACLLWAGGRQSRFWAGGAPYAGPRSSPGAPGALTWLGKRCPGARRPLAPQNQCSAAPGWRGNHASAWDICPHACLPAPRSGQPYLCDSALSALSCLDSCLWP